MNYIPDNDLDGEPRVTNTFNVEESIMRVGAVLVKCPGGHIGPCHDRDVPDHRDPHVRMGLQTK